MWEKEKLLVTSNFSFSHSVFYRFVLQALKDQGLFGKGLTNYYLYRRNPRVLYSRSTLRSMSITGYFLCMLQKQASSSKREVENQKRLLWSRSGFFLDGQCSDDKYIGASSFITPIMVETIDLRLQ